MTDFNRHKVMGSVALLFWFAWAAEAWAEPRFNALDPADPLYGEYQRNLCASTRSDYQRLAAARIRLDAGERAPAGHRSGELEEWVIGYVVTTALRDDVMADYQQNCLEPAAP
jgi:hypothetical protein